MLKFHCFYFLSSRTNELDEVPVFHLRLGEVSQLEPEDVLVLMEVFGFQAVGENNIVPLQDFVLGLEYSPCQHVSSIQISHWWFRVLTAPLMVFVVALVSLGPPFLFTIMTCLMLAL